MTLAQAPIFIVYAPDNFASEWGPGPAIEAAFEENCNCNLQFKTGDVLSRVILEGERTEADAVIGLKTDITKKVYKRLVCLRPMVKTAGSLHYQLSGAMKYFYRVTIAIPRLSTIPKK